MFSKFVRAKHSGFTLLELLIVIAIVGILVAILFPVFARAKEKARQVTCLSNMKHLGLALQQYAQDHNGFLPIQIGDGASPLPGNQGFLDNGKVPSSQVNWAGGVYPYVKNLGDYLCPTAQPSLGAAGKPCDPLVKARTNYLYNGVLMHLNALNGLYVSKSLAKVPVPSNTIMLQENSDYSSCALIRPRSMVVSGPYRDAQCDTGPKGENYSELHSGGGNLVFVDGHVKYQVRESIRYAQFGFGVANNRTVPTNFSASGNGPDCGTNKLVADW